MTILIVEDDLFFGQRIAEMLVDNGLQSQLVRTPREALELKIADYDAVVVDVMLPNDPLATGISHEESRGGFLTGVALARRIRKSSPRMPLVLFSGDIVGGEAQKWAKQQSVPFVFKHEDRSRLLSALSSLGLIRPLDRPRAFIVHGHDEAFLGEVKDFIQTALRWPVPIVLREEPSSGRTIIEKFEDYAGTVDWVFILLSPDDRAFNPKTDEERRRARQNVIFELGFFYGLVGRREGRVIVLRKGDVELPSDIHGVAWIDVTSGVRAHGEDIRRELRVP